MHVLQDLMWRRILKFFANWTRPKQDPRCVFSSSLCTRLQFARDQKPSLDGIECRHKAASRWIIHIIVRALLSSSRSRCIIITCMLNVVVLWMGIGWGNSQAKWGKSLLEDGYQDMGIKNEMRFGSLIFFRYCWWCWFVVRELLLKSHHFGRFAD